MWKFIPGDKYDLDDLLDFQKFFQQDLRYAVADYEKYKKFEKYGLPGFRTELLRRLMAIEESNKNLDIVRRAIESLK